MDGDSRKQQRVSSSELDELLARTQDIQGRLAKNSKVTVEKTRDPHIIEETVQTLTSIREDLSFMKRLLFNAKEALLGLYERFLEPTWKIVSPPLQWFARKYARIWNRFAFTNDNESGNRVLSRKRASLLLGLSFLSLMAFTPTGIGSAVRFVTIEPIVDGALIVATLKTETFYLYSSEEVDPEQNIHSVRGCKVGGKCSEKDASYFRVKPRLVHDFWKLLKYGNPIYIPDHVVAPIAPGVNKCVVTYYGYRMTSSWISRLMRSFQVYPTLLETSCTHIKSWGNIE